MTIKHRPAPRPCSSAIRLAPPPNLKEEVDLEALDRSYLLGGPGALLWPWYVIHGRSQTRITEMMAFVILFFLVVLFACVDVWYFVRAFPLIIKGIAVLFLKKLGVQKRKYSLKDVLSPGVIHGIVLPSDIDHHLHMNNSKYLREMDFGRQKMYFGSGMAEAMIKLRASTRVAAISIRYRRSLQLWDRFTLSSKVLHWSDAFYLEQRFINKDGFTCAIAMVKMIAKSKSGHVPTEEVVKLIMGEGESEKSPPATPELKSWMESLERSSESMRKEGSPNFVQKKNS